MEQFLNRFSNVQTGLKDFSAKSDNTQVNNIRKPIQKIKYEYKPMSYSNRIKLQNQKYKDDNSLFSGSRLLERTKELGNVLKTPAAVLAASTATVTSPAIAGRLLTGATSAVGFGGLGLGSGNSLKDAAYGAGGEALAPLIGKSLDVGGDIVNTIKTNYNDVKDLNKFANIYTYKKPSANILSSKSVDNAYKNLLNQHNTFVRGVSVNDKTLSNPQILQDLKQAGVYDPNIDKVIPKKQIGEYMATHIPGSNGYGRAGLGQFDKSGLYTSNSFNTAKGYTYGDGFIATVRRPVNYSSSKRIDWIKSGDFTASPLENSQFSFSKINNKTERDLAIDKIQEEQHGDFRNIMKRYDDLANNIYKRYDYNIDGNELANKIGLKKNDKIFELSNIRNKRIQNLPMDVKFGMNEAKLSEGVFTRGLWQKFKPTGENPYQHFIFRGNPGQKPVELIELQPFNSGIDDFTRSHVGEYSEGLSKKSFNLEQQQPDFNKLFK